MHARTARLTTFVLTLFLLTPAGCGRRETYRCGKESAMEREGTKSPTVVKRENDKVWIEGVKPLRWGEGKDNTFINALRVTANALGDDVSYDWLMGASGAAFRVQLCQPGWCPSAPDAGAGFSCAGVAMEALGYTTQGRWVPETNTEDVRKVREAIVRSIDHGVPVIGIDLVASADYGVITGYADDGATFLCRSYYDKTPDYAA